MHATALLLPLLPVETHPQRRRRRRLLIPSIPHLHPWWRTLRREALRWRSRREALRIPLHWHLHRHRHGRLLSVSIRAGSKAWRWSWGLTIAILKSLGRGIAGRWGHAVPACRT